MRYGKRVATIAVVASLVLVACGDDDEESGTGDTSAPEGTSAATDVPASGDTTPAAGTTAGTSGGGGGESILGTTIPCDQQYDGKTVSVFSPVRNNTEEPDLVALFVSFYQPFVDCTGITIDFQGTDQFETEIVVRIQGGSPPDVIDFPQPGLLRTLAQSDGLIPFPDDLAAEVNSGAFIPGWPELGTVDGTVYGMPWRANVKSLVWYSPAMFEAGGYEIPETLGELTALSDQIVADGGIPWCAGIESGVATGWPITDWFEDFMLRINGPEVYDQWVSHEIPFNDPQVKAVADAVGAILKNPDYIGGENAVKAIATTKFQEGGVPITTGDCYMHRQASFYSELFPDVTVGPPGSDSDITFFYLPVAEAGDPKVMLGAGDIDAAGTDKPETWDTIRYMSSVEFAIAMANGHAELSPRTDIDPASLSDPLLGSFQELLASAEIFRFDGADQMPGAVGSGTFWTEATAWIVGGSTEDMLDNIEASWPA